MTKFRFQISIKVLRWVRLIIFVVIFSTHIYFSLGEEQLLFEVYLNAFETDQWGAYDALTLTEKFCIWLWRLGGKECG